MCDPDRGLSGPQDLEDVLALLDAVDLAALEAAAAAEGVTVERKAAQLIAEQLEAAADAALRPRAGWQ